MSELPEHGPATDPSPQTPDPIAYATPGAARRPRIDWFSFGSFVCGISAPFLAGAVSYTWFEIQGRMQSEGLILYIYGIFAAMIIAALVLGLVGRRRINRSEGQLTGDTWGLVGISLALGWIVNVCLMLYMVGLPDF